MKKNNIISLEKICNKDDFILIDSCILKDSGKGPVKMNFSANYVERKYKRACNSCMKFSLWNEKIRAYDKIRLTKGVLRELEYHWNEEFLEQIKYFDYAGYDKKTRDCLLILYDNKKFVNKIIDFVRKNKRICDLETSQGKLYKSFREENKDLLEKVGYTDFQLLISGMILSELNYGVGIMTGDSKMVKIFNRLVEYEFSKEINFYKPLGNLFFKRHEVLVASSA